MSDEEIIKLYDDMVEEFGDKLPNPEHYPNVFLYYLKLYRYMRGM